MTLSRQVLLLSFLNLLAFGPLTASDKAKPLPLGTWGGEHAVVTVEAAAAEIEFDCAVGSIPIRPVLDTSGHFRLRGMYKAQSPAPAASENSARDNAIYIGTVTGNKLHLEIIITGRPDHLIFDLVHDQEGHLAKCA